MYPFPQLPPEAASYITVAQHQNQDANTGTILLTSLQALFKFLQFFFLTCIHLCVCIVLCNLIPRIGSITTTRIKIQSSSSPGRNSLCYPFIFTPPPPPSLYPGNHQSVLHLHSFVILVETHSISIGVCFFFFCRAAGLVGS